MEQIIIFLLRQMFNFSIPLLIVALGGMFASRSGILNIGLDGTMIFGALTSFTFLRLTQNTMSGNKQLLIAIVISVASGILISYLHALASINLKANQIISGTAINMFTPAFSIFVARLLFGEQLITFKNTFVIESVPLLSKIPFIGEILFSRIYITTYLGIAIFFIAAFVLNKTKFGLRLRACGEFPQAPDAVGVNVRRMRYAGVLISGGLSGLGGLIFVIPNSTQFNASVAGYGFLAFAVMIFGQWTPSKILFSAFFFGLMMTFSATYSGIPFLAELGVPGNYYKMLPYVVTIIVMMISHNNSKAPKAEGQPFEKGMR